MKKMLKRADGSYSQRGLWDNIRSNKGSGKEPTKEMLKQEKKIKASSKKTGGKSMYNFLEESKELKFGGPSKKQTGGPKPPRFTGTGTIQMPMPKPATKKKDNEKAKKAEPTSVYSNPRDLPSVRMDKSGKPVKKRMGGKNC